MTYKTLSGLVPGTVYTPKFNERYVFDEDIFARLFMQVGLGGDCGYFLRQHGERARDQFMFRVCTVTPTVRRDWTKISVEPIREAINFFQVYAEIDLSKGVHAKTTLELPMKFTPVDMEEFESLERMSFWETIHIFDRLKNPNAHQ